MEKTIKVSEKDWEKLWTLRMRLKVRKLADVVSWLLKKVKIEDAVYEKRN